MRIHPEILKKQQLPKFPQGNQIWKQRFEEINNFEKYLVNNGVIVLKFFLNVSKSVQRKRFLARIDSPEKHWKFSASDIRERAFWDDYMDAYEQVFNNTSTEFAPWYIVPADRKWFTRLVVADIICTKLQELNLQYPEISEENKKQLQEAKKNLEAEN